MAPKQKRPTPYNDPPPIYSEQDQEPSHHQEEDDDDDDDTEEETDSSDEQEGDHEQGKYLLSDAVQPPPRPKTDSESSDSDSESESEARNHPPTSKDKPLASKPKEQPPKVKQQPPSSSAATQGTSASKRPVENNGCSPAPKSVKKKKLEAVYAPASDEDKEAKKSSGNDSKKMIHRLFSDEDEVTVLEGMVEFRSVTGGDDPYKCADAFHDFMMKRSKLLSFEASSGQLKEKIRRLKAKFNNNARKGKNGEPPKFSKSNDQRAFELAQMIWGEVATAGGGSGVNNGGLDKAKLDGEEVGKKIATPNKEIITANTDNQNPKTEKAKMDSALQPPPPESNERGNVDERPQKNVGLGSMIRCDEVLGGHGLGEEFLRKADGLMEASKKAEFDGKWMKLEATELELRLKRAELYANHAKSMLQAIKSSKE